MIDRDGRGRPRVGVFPGYGQRLSHALVLELGPVGPQVRVHTAPDDFGDRHAEASRPVPDLSVLRRLDLYLKSHHDGIRMPSSRRRDPPRLVEAGRRDHPRAGR